MYDNCRKIVKGCEHVFNLAADMGGMGFIQSNHSVIMYNNTMISFNMVEVSRIEGVKRCSIKFLPYIRKSYSSRFGRSLTVNPTGFAF